ncbi:MAG TPA: efflux transporter outer membrane subunit [Lysobacter sp.]
MRAAALLIGVCVALTGCMLGPNYSRPELELPVQYRAPLTQAEARSIADVAWFDLFRDPELSALIREAIDNNLDLRQALSRVEQARANAAYARGSLGPDIRGTLSSSPSSGSGNHDTVYSAGLSLIWEIDLFGKLRRGSEAARANLLATEDAARGVMATLVTQVASSWLSLRELDEERAIIERTITAQEESLKLIRAQMRSGVASGAEEQQAIAQLATTRAQLPFTEQQILATENQLAQLLGRYPQSIGRDSAMANGGLPDAPAIPTGLPTELLERRPDVRLAENQLHAATARVGVAVANRFPFPTIGLSALFGRNAVDLSDLGSSNRSISVNSWGPYVDLPIIDFGRAGANVDLARAQTDEAAHTYRQTVLQALVEVSSNVSLYEKSASIISDNEESTAANRENLRLQRLRYKAGVNSYLEVLDAERQLLSSEINLARARLSRLTAYIDVYRALGGGWSDEELLRVAQ